MIIYKITNKINNKVYIGKTTRTIEKRWYQHCHCNNTSTAIHNAIVKYGTDNFVIEQIDSAKTIEELNSKEMFYIKYYNSKNEGYNCTDGGEGTKNYKWNNKQKEQASINNARFWKGKHLQEEHKKKISQSRKKCRVSDKTRSKQSIPIICIETNIEYFGSREAGRKLKINNSSIIQCCKGRRKTAGGYHWKYKDIA